MAVLEAYYEGEFPAGQALVMDAVPDGVELPMATSRFKTFSQADYDAILPFRWPAKWCLLKDSDVKAVSEDYAGHRESDRDSIKRA